MHHIRSAASPSLQGTAELTPKRGRIFIQKSPNPFGFTADPVTINLNGFELFLRLIVPAHLRTDHGHIMTSIPQRTGVLPHAPIQLHRQIFNDDEDTHDDLAYQQRPS